MIWARETEAGVFDTPERRAALEARLRDIARMIQDESVRRHYQQAFGERVAAFFPAAEPERRAPNRDWRERRGTGEWRGGGGGRDRDRGRGRLGSPPRGAQSLPISDRLKRSPLVAGRAAWPLREAVLLVTMINHPALVHRHLDDFAGLEFSHGELTALREAVLHYAGSSEEGDAAELRTTLQKGRFSAILPRLDGQIEACGYWPANAAAADRDAEEGWLQALTLQRRKQTLNRELKDAEMALATEPSEANLARLVDIQSQLAKSEGTEALIEGFGTSSGRQARIS
jgi:DNA primase